MNEELMKYLLRRIGDGPAVNDYLKRLENKVSAAPKIPDKRTIKLGTCAYLTECINFVFSYEEPNISETRLIAKSFVMSECCISCPHYFSKRLLLPSLIK